MRFFFAWLFLPLLALMRRNETRLQLSRQIAARQVVRQQQKAQRESLKVLRPESKTYAKIIVSTLTRLGEYYAPSDKKVQKVQFQRIVATEDIVYFQLRTNKKTLFGAKTALPHRVRIIDLIREDTLEELSYACHRHVEACHYNLKAGVWLKVYRNEGVDGLPKMVTWRSLLSYYPDDMSNAEVILGIGENRTTHYASFATHPHWLVGGSTGSGKSNFINGLVSSLIRFTDPTEVRFILIDLKMMEFPFYEHAPHLLRPVVTEAEEAIDVLNELKQVIRKRAKMLSGKAKELAAWNKKYPILAMPRIICVIDEFAELMIASGDEVAKAAEDLVSSITNLGRAVGIHIVVCTQRPAVSVVPNSIKVNMPLVVAGATPSAAQSRVILDTDDAAKLPDVPGRMAVRAGARISEIQTPYITDEDVIESVMLARGRYLAITKLNGIDTVIDHPGLTQYIVDTLQGSLSTKPMIAEICQYGVSRAKLREYLQNLMKSPTVGTFSGMYEIKKEGNSYRLVLAIPYELPPTPGTQQEQTEPEITEYPVDLNFVPYALIPANVPPIQPIDKVALFVEYYCFTDEICKDRATDLYNAFCYFFQQDRDYPINQTNFGSSLKAMGFTSKRSAKGGRFEWHGLRLRANEKYMTDQLNGLTSLKSKKSSRKPKNETPTDPNNGSTGSTEKEAA